MTNRRFRTMLMVIGATVIGAVTMAFAVSVRQAASPEALLGQAQHQQDVEGNFDAAIATYKQVIAHPKATRVLVARALLLMGACYEQLGSVEARRAYERIVKEFSDVSDVVAAARSKLSDLNAGPRAPSSALTMRRIYDGPGLDWCNGLSSNARYLSYPDWDTGDIGVADLTTGAVRRVTSHDQQKDEWGECTVFSPDDKQIAFFWETRGGVGELRTVGVDGSGLRTVYRDSERTYLRPLDWSADGRSVLVELYDWRSSPPVKTGGRIIAVVSMSDGTLRILKRGEDGGNSAAQFSPDGRYIAYSTRTSPESTKQDVFLMTADGSGDTALIRHPADDVLLGWSPDGKTVFFASDAMGSNGVWRIGVLNGRPEGAPALVKADVGAMVPVRMLNGTLYYQVSSNLSEIYTAPVDLTAGKLLAKAAPVKQYTSGVDAAADWSPDGRMLAYRSSRGGTGDWLSAPALVSVFTLDTGQERQIKPALEGLDFNDGPYWSPDGHSLLVIARQNTPEHGVYRVDVNTGATSLLVKAPQGQYLLHALWSRDGRSVFYTIGNPTRIVRRDLATGRDTDLVSLSTVPAGIPRIALSPDGRVLAFTAREGGTASRPILNLIPADGGAAREIHRAAERDVILAVTWTPDGRYLYFRMLIAPASGLRGAWKQEVWRATSDGRVVDKTQLTVSGSFSPDGRRLVFHSDQSKSELWALENLAPRMGK